MKTNLLSLLIGLVVLMAIDSPAATKTWDGSNSGNWNTAANWTNNAVPVNGDDLLFPTNAANYAITNDIPGLNLKSITFDAGTNTYTLRGNFITLRNGVTAESTATIEFPIQLDADQIFRCPPAIAELTISGNITNNGHLLTVNTDIGSTHISGVISGTGGLTKDGNGTLVLTGTNTYSGLTTKNGIGLLLAFNGSALGSSSVGTVQNGGEILLASDAINEPLTNNSATSVLGITDGGGAAGWSGNIVLNAGLWILTPTNCSLNISGVISGIGGITKTGPGTLTFSGSSANTYTNTTKVNEGTLLLDKSALNGAIQGPLIIGDGAGGVNADVVRLQAVNQIANSAPVTVAVSGLYDMDGFGDAIGSLSGSGNVVLGATTMNLGFDNSTATFSGVISGTGGINKFSGTTGTQAFDGNNTYTGITTVNGGTLLVNGFQPQSDVSIGASGTLGGTGTVGDIANVSGGVVSPGASAGILTCSNVTLSSVSSDYTVELNGPTAGTGYDQLNVRGTVSLGGSTLSVLVGASFAPAAGQSFTILNNDLSDAITGTFAGLPQGSFLKVGTNLFQISYVGGSGNDVTLTATNPPPGDRFWVNSLGGTYDVAGNWLNYLVARPQDNANFTNNANYQITWMADASAASAFFNASSGTVTQAVGGFSWLLTNSYIIGQNSSTTATVTHASGTLRITNLSSSAILEVRRGTNQLNNGLVEADRLYLTNLLGHFEFNGGTLITRGGVISNASFAVGLNGSTPAVWDVRAGNDTLLSSSLSIGFNVPNSQLFLTNGGKIFDTTGTIGSNGLANTCAALVAGAGSVWSNSSSLAVGWSGPLNQLVVSNGGKVYSASSTTIGVLSSSNDVFVTDTDSTLSSSTTMRIATLGSFNQLVVSNGGTVLDSNGVIGDGSTANNNHALITGASSVWTNRTSLTVGNQGNFNLLLISDGAMVFNTSGTIGASSTGASNSVVVSGLGSLWINSSSVIIGNVGDFNTLVVSNAGTVSADGLILGNIGSSTGNRSVVDGGVLHVTNASATAALDIRRGTNELRAGLVEVDRLLVTNVLGEFEFLAGTLSSRNTTNTNGRVFNVGTGDGLGPAILNLSGNGTHFFGNGLIISSSGTLAGNGTIIGSVTVQPLGTLSPGNSIGQLAFSSGPALQGRVVMEISKSGAILTNDQVQVSGTLTNGGSLLVTNIGPDAPADGNRFQLFSASSYAGSFTSCTWPPLLPGLTWANKLSVDGSIEVVAVSNPKFSSVTLSGTNLVFSGAHGPGYANYIVLAATNVVLPLTNWTPVLTNQFDGSGNFIFTNAISPSVPQRFYLLQLP